MLSCIIGHGVGHGVGLYYGPWCRAVLWAMVLSCIIGHGVGLYYRP